MLEEQKKIVYLSVLAYLLTYALGYTAISMAKAIVPSLIILLISLLTAVVPILALYKNIKQLKSKTLYYSLIIFGIFTIGLLLLTYIQNIK